MKRLLGIILTFAMIFNPVIVFAETTIAALSGAKAEVVILENSTEKKIIISSDTVLSDLTLYVAAYKENRLVKTVITDNISLVVGENSFDIEPTWRSSEREYVKAFLFDSALSPVAEGITILPPTIKVETVYADISDRTATVDISIKNNPGISSLKFDVLYDERILLTDVLFDGSIGESGYITAPEPFENPQTISLLSPNSEILENGTIATLVFDISGAPEDLDFAEITVNYDEKNAFNENFDAVVFDTVSGKLVFDEADASRTANLSGELFGEDSKESKTLVLSVSEKSAVVGGTVDVDINVLNNPGFSSLKFDVKYDEYLTLTNIEFNTQKFKGNIESPKPYGSPQLINILNSTSEITCENATLATLTFAISKDTPDGYEAFVDINCYSSEIFDINQNKVEATAEGSIVTIYTKPAGDVNEDGELTNHDPYLHFKYISNQAVEVDEDSLDTNDDGRIGNNDAMDLFRFIAGWDQIVLKRGRGLCPHTAKVEVPGVDASCTQSGYETYWKCDDCGRLFGDKDCTNKIYKPVVIEINGIHSLKYVAEVAPTCEDIGYKAHWKCEWCESIFEDANAIKKLEKQEITIEPEGHKFSTNWAYDENSHWHIYICDCEHKGETVDLSEHLWTNNECDICDQAYYSITYNNTFNVDTSTFPKLYFKHEGVNLPDESQMVRAGYTFDGWYDYDKDREIRIYNIPSGSEKAYNLTAEWTAIDYDLIYRDEDGTKLFEYTYTAKDTELKDYELPVPEMKGLKFVHLLDEGKNVVKSIKKGTIGDIEITAVFIPYRNLIVSAKAEDKNIMEVKIDSNGKYYYFYPLSEIENVVIEGNVSEGVNLRQHLGIADTTLSRSTTKTITENVGTDISNAALYSVSSSSGWDYSFSTLNSHTTSSTKGLNIGVGASLGEKDVKSINAQIGASFSSTNTDTNQIEMANSHNKVDSNGNEISSGLSTAVAYESQISITETTTETIPKDSPIGYYHFARCGNVQVYAVVEYDAKNRVYSMDTYSVIRNIHDVVLYYKDASQINNTTFGTLDYDIPMDDVIGFVDSCYYVEYVPNSPKEGLNIEGNMMISAHKVGAASNLSANDYRIDGYTFNGWKVNNTGTPYSDKQSVTNLTTKGETVKLYAQWLENSFTVTYNSNGGTGTMAKSNHNFYTPSALSKNTFTKEGHHFNGWKDQNGNTYSNGQQITLTENKTLTAQWAKNVCTVKYDTNCDGVIDKEIKYEYGDNKSLEPYSSYSKSEYTCIGWSTTNGAKTPNFNDVLLREKLLNDDSSVITLYPISTRTSYTLIKEHNIDYNEKEGATWELVNLNSYFDMDIISKYFSKMTVIPNWETHGGGEFINVNLTRIVELKTNNGTPIIRYAKHTDQAAHHPVDQNNLNNQNTIDIHSGLSSLWIYLSADDGNWLFNRKSGFRHFSTTIIFSN